ncbi:MAG TPA: Rne/Rng family ribonuclease [Anaeromyxobacteraceae bacterium]|nr:Rne/Rng family ribonuclease [Anaeromyxobacteraceae bacterium]
MAGNSILVINAAGAETRVALVESGTIHEYYLERKREKGIVGNIYKGRVVRVLPGMQAAFVDIGLEKAAFLYVGDVYGDPDFSEEFELTEGEHAERVPDVPSEQEAEEQEVKALAGEAPAADAAATDVPGAADVPVAELAAAAIAPEGEADAAAPVETPEPAADAAPVASAVSADAGGAEAPAGAPAPIDVPGAADVPVAELAPTADVVASPADAAAPIPLTQVVEGESAAPAAEVPAGAAPPATGAIAVKPEGAPREARGDRGDRNDRGDRGRRDREGREGREGRDRDGRRGRNGHNGHNGHGGGRREEERRPREQKNIQDLLKEGQEVIVQVAKDPIGTKGARITSHISIPGRHLVFMPTVDHVGISRRIERDGERRRLRELVDRMRPEGTGFIVRTVADGVEGAKLEADIRFLIQVWNEIIRTKDKVGAPALLHPDLDLILRATRDLFTSDVSKLVIDDRDEYERILRFVREQAPHLEAQIELYSGQEPIFDAYGIEQELKRAGQRKVWLKSGGYIIIDQAEALTAIDVNSGRYVGKKNLEETITKINVEAAKEVVYQLRLRNIGGIIIIDFIDMDKPQNRDKVFKSLQDALGRDKAKTNVLKISELGLVEMTRKRVRESVTRMTTEPCSYCDGKGHVKSKVTVAYEIFREIRRDAPSFPEPVLVVNCHPEVARIVQGADRDELRYLMDRFNKTIQVKPQTGYHQEQFDIYGRQERGEGGESRDGGGGGRGRRDRGGRGGGGGGGGGGGSREDSGRSGEPG